MTPREAEERVRVRDEARKWLRTPYHHKAALLGHGVDCANILLETFVGAGLIERFEPEDYTHDWHLHRDEERYLAVIESYCRLVDGDTRPLRLRSEYFSVATGDILMWRHGRTFSHSAIVTDWPFIIHAHANAETVEEVDVRGTPMYVPMVRIYSFWNRP